MGTENKSKSHTNDNRGNNSRKRKPRYLPHNKAVKKKGSYPLRPGVQGFFNTCDGGRERQASHEAINVIDSFYEELVHGKDSAVKLAELPNKPSNKKIKFSYSDSSGSDDDEEEEEEKEDNKSDARGDDTASHKDAINQESNPQDAINQESDPHTKDDVNHGNQTEEKDNDNDGDGKNDENQPDNDNNGDGKNHENQPKETEEPPAKKPCVETVATKSVIHAKVGEKSIDKLIEAELEELGDKNKRRFFKLDTSCNGVVFIQMRKRDGEPSPINIVQHMMTSLASTRKHMSRFILRILPIEVACYASEEEISRAIKPLVAEYFPVETQNPQKFAVLYEARANSGIDRMKIINAVAKSIPGPHKVDLKNPDKSIVVEIVKTVCLIGVVEKYKELAKYNIRQLTSSQP
ncbi:LOW QUALITY PROTEIN: AP2/ERF domain-containing protein PFD0985w [Quercus lobata]|uniref:LOW QUALITY PROTEIN: AP2/ERF domain-containing protein PFD0985w n=1 Tax=Quercus lobata TaxID=97700 RepID=UPI001244A8BA|nr:LOW QUALITY PROTEIN: AP2/ERF domain-containing protein PFD0985w [Quercus lobata]